MVAWFLRTRGIAVNVYLAADRKRFTELHPSSFEKKRGVSRGLPSVNFVRISPDPQVAGDDYPVRLSGEGCHPGLVGRVRGESIL